MKTWGLPFLFELVVVVSQCALCHGYKPYAVHVQLCQSVVLYSHYLAKEYHKENVNVYCFVVVFPLQFKQLQRIVTMALKSLYRVCVIKKLDLIFSCFSVRNQNHSFSEASEVSRADSLMSSRYIIGERA